jgi:hypothetical protein
MLLRAVCYRLTDVSELLPETSINLYQTTRSNIPEDISPPSEPENSHRTDWYHYSMDNLPTFNISSCLHFLCLPFLLNFFHSLLYLFLILPLYFLFLPKSLFPFFFVSVLYMHNNSLQTEPRVLTYQYGSETAFTDRLPQRYLNWTFRALTQSPPHENSITVLIYPSSSLPTPKSTLNNVYSQLRE